MKKVDGITNRSYTPLLVLDAYRGLCTRADTKCFCNRALTLDVLAVVCQIYVLWVFLPLDADLVASPNDSGIVTQSRLKKPSGINCFFNSR